MLNIPELKFNPFGDSAHMPRYADVPDEFKERYNDYTKAISHWFFNGAKQITNGIMIKDKTFTAKEGVDCTKALAAIRQALGSWDCKHEHKEAGCAYMLSEWFEMKS